MATEVTVGAEPAVVNLKWRRGDALSFSLTFIDENDAAIDMSAFSFIAQYLPIGGTETRESFTIDETNSASGVILLQPPLSEDIASKGTWDLRQLDGNGDVIRTLVEGDAFAKPAVSQVSP